MGFPSRYPIPSATARAETVVDRSRFICTLSHADSAAAAQAAIRAAQGEFPDATHHCWAFVAGPPGSTAQIGMSDDGEPHGTAGRPMLTVLLHAAVGEVVAVVTRYYGGTKLGTGGLARAYSGAVQAAMAILPTREKVEYVAVRVEVHYAHFSAVQHLLPAHEADIAEESFAEVVVLLVRVPVARRDDLMRAIGNATHGQAHITDADLPRP